MIRSVFQFYSSRSRKRRALRLRQQIGNIDGWKILDLGGGTGEHIAKVFPDHRNVTVCDYDKADLEVARDKFGYETVLADGSETLPFHDGEFDLVFCSSVIEHVTGPKDYVLKLTDDRAFEELATKHQRKFASEISRISKRYYVQTPHRYFPIESHSWLPALILLLKRRSQLALFERIKNVWPKRTHGDFYLLTSHDMQRLFPDADILIERSFGFPKSIMALRSKF